MTNYESMEVNHKEEEKNEKEAAQESRDALEETQTAIRELRVLSYHAGYVAGKREFMSKNVPTIDEFYGLPKKKEISKSDLVSFLHSGLACENKIREDDDENITKNIRIINMVQDIARIMEAEGISGVKKFREKFTDDCGECDLKDDGCKANECGQSNEQGEGK
ncbi:hypothetical protein FACS189496_4160 [Bacilli bacterium]|nr:hypothetical protein FACS189496_4160 [Bacilli bacterium]